MTLFGGWQPLTKYSYRSGGTPVARALGFFRQKEVVMTGSFLYKGNAVVVDPETRLKFSLCRNRFSQAQIRRG